MPASSLSAKKAVIFDLDGTLYHQKPVQRGMLHRLLRAHALRPLEGLRAIRFLQAYRRAQETLRNETGPCDLADRQTREACSRTGIDPRTAASLVSRWMDEAPLDLVRANRREGLLELLQALRDQGILLGILSDYPARGKLETLEIDHLFDTVVTAQDPSVGAFKPSPRGIEAALDRLGARSADSLYVGDRVDVDYPAALAANVDCALFISNPPKPAPFICLESCSHLQRLLLP